MKSALNSRSAGAGRTRVLAVVATLSVATSLGAQVPLPADDPARRPVPLGAESGAAVAGRSATVWGLQHPESPRREPPQAGKLVVLRDVPAPTEEELLLSSGAHVQGHDLVTDDWEEAAATDVAASRRLSEPDENPRVEPPPRRGLVAPPSPGDHVREFEGEGFTGSFPPDTVVAVGSQHVVEAVNRGITVFDKFGNLVQGYRSFGSIFDNPAGMSLFDPKIIWSNQHGKFALLVLGRDTAAQEARFYVAVSHGANAVGEWSWWSWNAESFGDGDAWLDFASLGGDEWGLYVTGNMMLWAGGFKHSKLWAISPSIWSLGSPANWVWVDLEWPDGSNAYSLEVADPHTSAFDEATFFVNTRTLSGSDAVIWRLVGNRGNGDGLSLSRNQVDIDDYDTISSNIDQPDSPTHLHGGRTHPGNAVYADRRVFFSQTTDPYDDGSRSALLTTKVDVDQLEVEWSHRLTPSSGNYYFYPAIALRGPSPGGHLAVFYSYTSTPDSIHPSSGFKLYTDQPIATTGPNQLYQLGEEEYVRLDSVGRNRWGDYSGADYDWQCGHLWGATELAGTSDQWRTRIKAINGNGESTCSLLAVVSPNGGETLVAGDSVQVEWDRSAVPGGTTMYVFLSLGGGLPIPIATELPTSASSAVLEVPNTPTTTARIFVGAWDGAGYPLSDWSDLEFTIQGRPDLVTEIDPPHYAVAGEEVAVPNTLTNLGEAPGGVSLSLALSTNSICSTSDTLLLTRVGGDVQPGQSNVRTSNVTIPADTAPGVYHLCAIADWSDTIEEFDETNNASGAPIEIVAPSSIVFRADFEPGDASEWSAAEP